MRQYTRYQGNRLNIWLFGTTTPDPCWCVVRKGRYRGPPVFASYKDCENCFGFGFQPIPMSELR